MIECIDIIHSPLEQKYSADGHRVWIKIYRGISDSQWILEIEDECGTYSVWDDPFDTDKMALEEALMSIETGGIGNFICKASEEAKAAKPELLKGLGQTSKPKTHGVQNMMPPLSDDELEELDQFLLQMQFGMHAMRWHKEKSADALPM